MYTEEEAKTRWCPFARTEAVGAANDIAINRDSDGNTAGAKCLASGCMAWRGQFATSTDGRGYCGLAGRQ